MIALIRGEAYRSCSRAIDVRATPMVSDGKGTHGILPAGLLF